MAEEILFAFKNTFYIKIPSSQMTVFLFVSMIKREYLGSRITILKSITPLLKNENLIVTISKMLDATRRIN
ncbi:hypothetical protein [Solimicrobium silvestre]|uniref:Uncharacterized protein n=1 Tax=Solimicrobium silvestre TaxID=2099400 RepID=A0A2S9GSW1_9BURK|nr:hypothetical protein [Solimicrobium silvestre]PRC90800.1 hypothetical protein S2091_4463 [Solimicrobium silvestre]